MVGSFVVGLFGGVDFEIFCINFYVLLIIGVGGLMIVGISWNLMLGGLGMDDKCVCVGSMMFVLLFVLLGLWLVWSL